METKVLSVLVIFLACVHFGNCTIGQVQHLQDVLMKIGPRSLARSGATNYCTIKKVEDTCSASGPPACISSTCTFVPEYGEEITSFWQLFLDGYSSLFNRNKKYRRILDLGEGVTKSFDGEVCEHQNSICDCTASNPAECTCDKKDRPNIKVCKQKYTYKFSLYYVYNFFFCEPKADPWALLFKKLTGSQRRFSYADTRQPPFYPPYKPQSQNPSFASIFKYIQLLKKDKHHHLGNLVVCDDQPAYTPPRSPYHNPYAHKPTPDYHKPAYLQNPRTLVPSGCECEEL